jgi:hypothetical protein
MPERFTETLRTASEPIRRNPEDDLDLADIGGEAGAATHAAILAPLELNEG